MFCSSCGVATAHGLSYCNHCGANLKRGDSIIKSSEIKPESLISAMASVFILGLMAIIVLMGVMKAVLGFNVGQILAFTLLSFLIMLLLEGVFIRLLFRRTSGTEEAGHAVLLKGQPTKELEPAAPGGLPEASPSVTEHTTRTFDPIYSERRSK